jgi:hypothetical protein
VGLSGDLQLYRLGISRVEFSSLAVCFFCRSDCCRTTFRDYQLAGKAKGGGDQLFGRRDRVQSKLWITYKLGRAGLIPLAKYWDSGEHLSSCELSSGAFLKPAGQLATPRLGTAVEQKWFYQW